MQDDPRNSSFSTPTLCAASMMFASIIMFSYQSSAGRVLLARSRGQLPQRRTRRLQILEHHFRNHIAKGNGVLPAKTLRCLRCVAEQQVNLRRAGASRRRSADGTAPPLEQVDIEMIGTRRVERRRPSLDTVDLVSFTEQKLREREAPSCPVTPVIHATAHYLLQSRPLLSDKRRRRVARSLILDAPTKQWLSCGRYYERSAQGRPSRRLLGA